MSSQALGDLLATLGADTSKFRDELNKAKDVAKGATTSISTEFDKIERRAKASSSQLGRVGSAVTKLGGEFGGAAGKAAGFGQALLGAVGGGPVMLGLTALTVGVGALVSHMRDTAKAAEEARQKQVEAWRASTEAITKANDELREQLRLKELLFGLDTAGARNVRMAESAASSADHNVGMLEARKERLASLREFAEGSAALPERVKARQEYDRLRKQYGDLDTLIDEAKTIARDAALELEQARFLAEQEGQRTGGNRGLGSLGITGEAGAGAPGVDGGFRAKTDADRQRDAAEAAARAFRIRQSGYDVLIKRAELLGNVEDEIEQKKLKALDQLEQRQKEFLPGDYAEARRQVEQEADDAITAHRRAQAQQIRDIEIQNAIDRAKATETQVDDLQVAMEKEIAAVEEAIERKVMAEQLGADRIAAIRESYGALIDRQAQVEIEAAEKKRLRAEQEAERDTAASLQTGMNVGLAFADGMTSILNEKKPGAKGILKGILGMGGAVIANLFPGVGTVIGGGLSAIAMRMAEGGHVRGPGTSTSDSIPTWLSNDEFVNRAASVKKFGVPFFKRLNEGVLDLSLVARRFASGGLVGGGAYATPAMAGGGGGANVYVSAFDPASTAEALAKLYEPAAITRGLSHSDSRTVALVQRQTRAPRSGR